MPHQMNQTNPGRILAIDYGCKRIGIAVTDPLQIIATPLTTIQSTELLYFLEDYIKKEPVCMFVMGLPQGLNGKPTEMSLLVQEKGKQLQTHFPKQKLYYYDERFTSKMATQGLYHAGYSKKDRQQKANIDKISAAILLQSFLNSSIYTQLK